jgi:hypothetical protein
MTGTEVFKRTALYEREIPNIRLHAPQWKLLLTFDGQRSLSEVALNSGMPFTEALPMAEDFLKREWIAEQPITLEEYLKRANSGGNYSGGVIPSSVVLQDEKGSENKREKASVSPLATASTVTEIVAPPKELPRTTARGTMRLSVVVDFIISVAETIPLGQLLAYRVFLRVPPEILQSEEIVSIHLVDDTSIVRSESLQKAISSAVHEIIKRPLPDSVYAPA